MKRFARYAPARAGFSRCPGPSSRTPEGRYELAFEELRAVSLSSLRPASSRFEPTPGVTTDKLIHDVLATTTLE